MFACIQSGFGVVVVRLVGSTDDHELDLRIGAYILDRAVDDLWRDAEALLHLAAFGLRVTLEHRVKFEELRECEHKGHMES